MTQAFPTGGLWMLLVLALLIFTTGLPVWVLLVGTASLFSMGGWILGVFDIQVLSAMSSRVLGLLEHDLLQALPLYVFIGILLQRLTVADTLFSAIARLFGWTGAGTSVAALGVGVLVSPMNGSVASSSAMMARLVAPRLGRMNSASATALISVSSTIGVVVPPSLVLILLGNAMLSAHTEASNLPGYSLGQQRIINTQDVFHAALLPASLVLVLWLVVAWWQGRGQPSVRSQPPLTLSQWVVAAAAFAGTLLLLGSVFMGQMFSVEAAATGGVTLILASWITKALTRSQWASVLADTLNLSGALLALLVGATTFSLVFRLWGTDHWISSAVLGSPFSPASTAALVLLVVAICAWVLDAFEMIFVIIPIIGPLLIMLLGDAQQSAVLLLFALQLSFLIPPMGYAVMMARSRSGLVNSSIWHTVLALLPFIAVQCAIAMGVFLNPAIVHQLDAPPTEVSVPLSAEEIEQQMREMSEQTNSTETPAR